VLQQAVLVVKDFVFRDAVPCLVGFFLSRNDVESQGRFARIIRATEIKTVEVGAGTVDKAVAGDARQACVDSEMIVDKPGAELYSAFPGVETLDCRRSDFEWGLEAEFPLQDPVRGLRLTVCGIP